MAPPGQEAESNGLENLSEKEENRTSTSIAVGLGDSERLADQFLTLGLPLESEVLDVACGTGVVGEQVRQAGYTQVDGLDPSKAYLEGAMDRGIFRRVYCNFVDPVTPTPIPDNSYDALLCCAGFFQGLISPLSFPELIRITKPGGFIMWNIATGYEHYGKDYAKYDDIIMDLVRERRWSFAVPLKKHSKMAFTDCGHSYLRGFQGTGGIECEGYTYIMRKL